MPSWMETPWLAFDCESTSVDVETGLILSAALVDLDPTLGSGGVPDYMLLNWEVDIPEASAKIHGLTREHLAQEGVEPAWALGRIVRRLSQHLEAEQPVVGMNLPFDLTMLDRNCRRAGVSPIVDHQPLVPCLDAMVLDKYADPYRKGKRNLTALSEHYQVAWKGDAHNALSDAVVAAGVCWRIGRLFPSLGSMDVHAVHQLQMQEKRVQDESFRRYLLDQGKPADDVDGNWPFRWLEA